MVWAPLGAPPHRPAAGGFVTTATPTCASASSGSGAPAACISTPGGPCPGCRSPPCAIRRPSVVARGARGGAARRRGPERAVRRARRSTPSASPRRRRSMRRSPSRRSSAACTCCARSRSPSTGPSAMRMMQASARTGRQLLLATKFRHVPDLRRRARPDRGRRDRRAAGVRDRLLEPRRHGRALERPSQHRRRRRDHRQRLPRLRHRGVPVRDRHPRARHLPEARCRRCRSRTRRPSWSRSRAGSSDASI